METAKQEPLTASRLPRQLSLTVAGVFILAALAPYPVIGETYGMVWFIFTQPFSSLIQDFLPHRLTFVLLTTGIAALGWAVLIYVLAKMILSILQAMRGK